MKKELALHFLTTLILFIPIFFLKFLNISFLPFLIGGIVGTLLPDIDHIIYVYYLHPYEVTSQRVMYQAQKGNLMASWDLLSNTRSERKDLILHTVVFQIIFVLLSFLVFTSSTSLFGRGLVLAFLLHLLVDEYLDLKQTGTLINWFKNLPIQLDNLQLNVYLLTNAALILIFGFLL